MPQNSKGMHNFTYKSPTKWMRLNFQEALIKPIKIATRKAGQFVVFGGCTYISSQTASDFYWILQVIKRFILLKKKHYFFEWP